MIANTHTVSDIVCTEPPLEFYLLGAPQILLHGTSLVPVLSRKAQALLYFLASSATMQQRSRLASLFWADVPEMQARKNLRNITPELRKLLGGFLHIDNEVIGFKDNHHPWVDVASLLAVFDDPTNRTDSTSLLKASLLYQGDFLEGFFVASAPFYEEWIIARREQYRHYVVDGLFQAAKELLNAEESALGLQVVRRLLEIERWHEAAHRLVMQFLVLDGQRAAALVHYQKLCDLLQSELGVAPDEATEALKNDLEAVRYPASTILSRAGIELPSPTLSRRIRHNFAPNSIHFISHTAQVDRICEALLSCPGRLLNLVGEDGIGKTQLALAVARQVLHSLLTISAAVNFPDGIWYVAFSKLDRSKDSIDCTFQFAAEIARSMNCQFVGNQAISEQLLTYLRHKTVLLIFDDVDHFLPEITDFLKEILATSKQSYALILSCSPLELPDESRWQVEGLALPQIEDAQRLTWSAMARYESIALFVACATQFTPGFPLNEENLHHVLLLCQLAQGIPLAIEMLARQTRQLSCAEIYRNLLKTIRESSADLSQSSQEQRTLQAVITCSWNLLSTAEQQALKSALIFQGDFTSDALLTIGQIPTSLLTSLEEKSFLMRSSDRYAIHKLVRQFADSHHSPIGVQKLMSSNYCNYYLDLLANRKLVSKSESQTQEMILCELDNIRQAWQWATQNGEIAQIEKALPVLIDFYRHVGYFQELTNKLDMALVAVRQKLSVHRQGAADSLRSLLGRLLVEQAYFCVLRCQDKLAVQLATEGVTIGEALKLPEIAASGYCSLALLSEQQGDIGAAHKFAKTALSWATSGQLTMLKVRCQNFVGRSLIYMGSPAASLAYFQNSLKLAQAKDLFWEALTLGDISLAYLSLGDSANALRCIQSAQSLSQRGNFVGASAWANLLLGELLLRQGQLLRAQQSFEDALSVYSNIGQWLHECIIRQRLSRLFAYVNDDSAALRNAEESIRLALTYDIRIWLAASYASKGHALVALARFEEAENAFHQSLETARQLHSRGDIRTAELALANLYLLQNNSSRAMQLVESHLPLPENWVQFLNSDPEFVWLTCYRVLVANDDPRAHYILGQAEVWLLEEVKKIEEPDYVRSFWENNPNRAILRSFIHSKNKNNF